MGRTGSPGAFIDRLGASEREVEDRLALQHRGRSKMWPNPWMLSEIRMRPSSPRATPTATTFATVSQWPPRTAALNEIRSHPDSPEKQLDKLLISLKWPTSML